MGERWVVEEEAPVAVAYPTFRSYISETVGSYTIVFRDPVSQKKRYAEWHNPLEMCDIEDLQIMFAGSRARR
jgi:hypothetical protein